MRIDTYSPRVPDILTPQHLIQQLGKSITHLVIFPGLEAGFAPEGLPLRDGLPYGPPRFERGCGAPLAGIQKAVEPIETAVRGDRGQMVSKEGGRVL